MHKVTSLRKFVKMRKVEGHMIKKGDPNSYIHEEKYNEPGDNAYVYDVFWQDGCKSDVSQRNAFNPMGEWYNCTTLLERDYKKCESNFNESTFAARLALTQIFSIGYNDGVGGKITVGCVSYKFSVGNTFDNTG